MHLPILRGLGFQSPAAQQDSHQMWKAVKTIEAFLQIKDYGQYCLPQIFVNLSESLIHLFNISDLFSCTYKMVANQVLDGFSMDCDQLSFSIEA